MKIFLAFLLFSGASIMASCQSATSQQNTDRKPPFTLEITASLDKNHSEEWDFVNCGETTLKAGSMVVIAVRKTNISDHEINKLVLDGQTIEVRDSSGNPVAHRKSRNLSGSLSGMHRPGTKDNVLQPGETRMHTGQLSEGYDMSQPGTYTIQISERVSDDTDSKVVKSNKITVTVLPPSPPADESK
jgi:hypothetical protein